MSYRELFVSPSTIFSGLHETFEQSEYVIVGAPLDITSTFRSGTRFAPLSIREASLNIETYSFRAGIDLEDLRIHDLGDLHVSGDINETLNRIELVTRELLEAEKTPIFVGGEHTITLGTMRGIDRNVVLVSFDAHLDLRNEYLEQSVSHTTFMRRVHEKIRPEKILGIGTRAVCKEELDYARKFDIPFLTAQQIRNDGVKKTMDNVAELLGDYEKVYLTVDIDVLDPAFAPAVQNPESDGLNVNSFLNILCGLCDKRVLAFDLVEVAPHYDLGTTAILAAKTLLEALCHIENARKSYSMETVTR